MRTHYTVRPGDTLSSIARRHGCSLAALQSCNATADPRRLQIGSTLVLPDTRERALTQRPLDTATKPKEGPIAAPLKAGQSSAWTARTWKDISDGIDSAYAEGVRIGHGLLDSVLQSWREVESTEAIHQKIITRTEQRKPEERRRPAVNVTTPSPGKRHKDEVIAQLRGRLFAVAEVVQTAGVRLSRNERRMIVAAVGLCEVDNSVFGSRNTDQEFIGRKFGKRGIETGYSRIVHIGLSYGYIQYTQDGGGLGKLLTRMREKDRVAFDQLFPNWRPLLEMTTTGLPDREHPRFGRSGQAYWNGLSKADKAALKSRANTDSDGNKLADKPLGPEEQIRGARVQRIPYVAGYPAIDLWEDYKDLAMIGDQQARYIGYSAAFKAAATYRRSRTCRSSSWSRTT